MCPTRSGLSVTVLALAAVGLLTSATYTAADECDGYQKDPCLPCQFLDGYGELVGEGQNCSPPTAAGCSGWQRVEVLSNYFCCQWIASGVGIQRCNPLYIVVVTPYGSSGAYVATAVCLEYSVCDWDDTGNACAPGPVQKMYQPLKTTYYCNQG